MDEKITSSCFASRHFDTRQMQGLEVEAQRNENSKTFALGKGMYQTVVYPEKVHYLDTKGNWQEIDNHLQPAARGEQALETTSGPLRTRLALRADAERLVTMWERPILEVDGMYELVKELKDRGYKVYLLSNASVRQHEYWPRIPAAQLFDGKLISSDVHLVKPQPEIYRLFCDTFQVLPEECFFIDDSPQNIEGAYEVGMQGVIFHGEVGALRESLRAAGVAVD